MVRVDHKGEAATQVIVQFLTTEHYTSEFQVIGLILLLVGLDTCRPTTPKIPSTINTDL